MEFYTFHLFAGAGGGILADELLGFKPIGAVEIEPYPREVLLSRQIDGCLPRFPIWDDVQTFSINNENTREYIQRLQQIRGKLCICGGFPCQNISAAGKGEGIKGEKSGLWKEFARIISEVQPAYVFVENSPLLIKRGLDVVLQDIAERGYSFAYRIISAQDIGAPHLRKRFWGFAVSNSLLNWERGLWSDKEMEENIGENTDSNLPRQQIDSNRFAAESEFIGLNELCSSVSNALYNRDVEWFWELQKDSQYSAFIERGEAFDESGKRWSLESNMGGMAYEFSNWLDRSLNHNWFVSDEFGIPRIAELSPNRAKRLKAIGNAQVPLCAATAFAVLLKDFVELTKE